LSFDAAVFFLSVLLVLYVYAGYPALAMVLGPVLHRTIQRAEPGRFQPTVTVVIAAYNEAASIGETVRNKLDLSYPAEKLNVIVVSDQSDDGTDEIVTAIGDPRVTLLRQTERAGKTAALNLAMKQVDSEIIVFSDANSLYRADTLNNLLAPLADPAVGYVTGRMVYRAPDGSLTGEGCSAYMTYENALRSVENQLGSIVGVDGGVDALRRSLFTELRPDQLPDFVQPLHVIQQGYRVVYEPQALLYEDALADAEDEFRMRVRVGLRAFHGLKDMAQLFNPLRYGLFAWQLLSHKVLRYMVFLFMLTALLSNLSLALDGGPIWRLLLAGQGALLLTAVWGHLTRRGNPPRLVGWVYYFFVVNLASGLAFWQFLLGRKQVIWKPRT